MVYQVEVKVESHGTLLSIGVIAEIARYHDAHFIEQVPDLETSRFRPGSPSSADTQGHPLLQDTKFGEKAWDFEGVFSECSRDVARSHGPQTANRSVAKSADDLWSRLCADAAGVFGERDVANPVQTVFDSPVTSPPLK